MTIRPSFGHWRMALIEHVKSVVNQFTETNANRIIALGTIILALLSYCGLQDARTTFDLGTRAWISPIAVGLKAPLKRPEPISVGIWYDNVGKLPALDLHEHYTFYSSPNADMDSGAAMSKVAAAEICKGIEPSTDAEVVYPNSGGVKMTISVKPVNPQTGKPTPLYEGFMSGNHSLIVHICIAYKTLDHIHHSQFCYFYRPGLTEGTDLNRCDKGNRAD